MRKPEHTYFFKAARHTGAFSHGPKVQGNGWEAACCKQGSNGLARHSLPAVQSFLGGNCHGGGNSMMLVAPQSRHVF